MTYTRMSFQFNQKPMWGQLSSLIIRNAVFSCHLTKHDISICGLIGFVEFKTSQMFSLLFKIFWSTEYKTKECSQFP